MTSNARLVRKALASLANPDSRYAVLAMYLQQVVAEVLRITPTGIALDRPLITVGLDSITALELQFLIEQEFSVQLSPTMFFEGASIQDLARYLAQSTQSVQHEEPDDLDVRGTEPYYPLSHGQRGLWFLHQLDPTNTAYHIPIALRLRGQLDRDAFREALVQLCMRHAMLRTTFWEQHGEPVQQAQTSPATPLVILDASEWSEQELGSYLQSQVDQPFDMLAAPPIRVSLLVRGPAEHILVCVVHHILVDFWSLVLMIRDLERLYEAARCATPFPMPETIAYRDYIHHQARLLKSAEGDRLWSYWKHQLSDGIPSLDLFVTRPQPVDFPYRGSLEHLSIVRSLAERLWSLSMAHRVTPYLILLSAFAVLLHRYTGQHRIVIGSPIAGRLGSRWAEVVGYFVNPIPVQIEFSRHMSFAQLLEQVRQTVLDGIEYQALPLPVLVERLQREAPGLRSTLFQTMFVWQQTPRFADPRLALLALGTVAADFQFGDLKAQAIPLDRRAAPAELTLTMSMSEQGLEATIEYNVNVFDAPSIRRMFGHFQVLLGSLAADPNRSLAQLPLLTEEELTQLLSSWHTARSVPRQISLLHQSLEQKAQQCPEAIALIWRGERLTYAELNRRANQLAHYLRRRGVGPEDRVGVLVERRPGLIVLVLAILKAGGVYVPLDPAYPAQRLGLMVADARAALLVTQRSLVDRLPGDGKLSSCLFLDDLEKLAEDESSANPSVSICEQHLAYVIYTSGSTGKPKGVAIEHRSACALVNWALSVYSSDALCGVLATTSICFDLSIFELFVPLASGGTIILASDALDLAALASAHPVTLINTVPSAATELLRLRAIPASARVVNLAGEPLSGALVEQLYTQTSVDQIYNLYGPTEDTTYSTAALVPRDDLEPPSIGRPIAGTSAYLLDGSFNPVPAGVLGEIFLGGAGLARGYLHRADLTADRFLPNPFSALPGERLYRTGDLAYVRSDGQIMFFGRYDHQIKLRGYRIELGEIETILLRHPQIHAAVAHVWDGTRGEDRQLVAYIVPSSSGALAVEDIYDWAQRHLPAYMLPTRITMLEALPLTPNGKVDRRALPAPQWAPRVSGADSDRPPTATELAIIAIWKEYLDVPAIGIYDTFFALGGHSLLLTRVLARLRDVFQVDLPLRAVFEIPTVTHIADIIDRSRPSSISEDEPILAPISREAYRKRIHGISKDGSP